MIVCAFPINPDEEAMPLALSPTAVPVVVDEAKCIADKGCTVCVDVCPLDVLRAHQRSHWQSLYEIRRVLVLHAVREGLSDRRCNRQHPLSVALT